MTTKVEFETATIAEAIKAADRVAPTKGAAFDKAHGIVIEIDPGSSTVVVRSTNGDLFYMSWVDHVAVEGEATTWRVPSKVFTQVVTSLPYGTGKTVSFEESTKGQINMVCGRTKARFGLIHHADYPMWAAFDPDGLFPASDLGGTIGMVEWAAAKVEIPLCGVHFDGKQVVATDRYRLVRVPLTISDLDRPITVPAGLLSQVIKQTGEVMIGTDGNQLLVMPDEYTQIRCVIFDEKYQNVERVMSNHRDYPESVEFSRDSFVEVINRTMAFQGNGREVPLLRTFLGNEEIRVMMANKEQGMLGDVLEIAGQATHDMCEIKFTPKNLLDALANCPNDRIRMHYNPDRTNGLIYITSGTSFEVWVMPRAEVGESNG
jgi:DNA polymerase III sliding clamp (beta) subunit (PCNA family)